MDSNIASFLRRRLDLDIPRSMSAPPKNVSEDELALPQSLLDAFSPNDDLVSPVARTMPKQLVASSPLLSTSPFTMSQEEQHRLRMHEDRSNSVPPILEPVSQEFQEATMEDFHTYHRMVSLGFRLSNNKIPTFEQFLELLYRQNEDFLSNRVQKPRLSTLLRAREYKSSSLQQEVPSAFETQIQQAFSDPEQKTVGMITSPLIIAKNHFKTDRKKKKMLTPPATPKKNLKKKFELNQIKGNVAEFSCDQHGSRLIQQFLESASDADKELVFSEVAPCALELMTDVFGNYVIQKFLENGTQRHRDIIADKMANHVFDLSVQMYGCRVVQRCIEVASPEKQALIVMELNGHVVECVRNQNGNHVIQKAIEKVDSKHIQFIVDSFNGNLISLAMHPYGCRVIQRIFEHCPLNQISHLLSELYSCIDTLVFDQFGNYVIQHILENGDQQAVSSIFHAINRNLLEHSRHKFASNVVERCLSNVTKEELSLTVSKLLENDGSIIISMLKDQFANYVVQKLFEVCDLELKQPIIDFINLNIAAIKRLPYGKHVVAKVEKTL